MSARSFVLKPLALAALLGLTGAAHASFTMFESSTTFASAVTKSGTDAFANVGVGSLGTTINRTAGTYTYTANGLDDVLYGLGGALSTNNSSDRISFTSFSTPITAIGGNFYNTLTDGTFVASQPITLTVIDAAGSHAFVFTNSLSTSSFFGITSTSGITALYVQTNSDTYFPTVDNLQLAVTAAVPEPETYALMLGGLGLVAWMRRRQSKSAG